MGVFGYLSSVTTETVEKSTGESHVSIESTQLTTVTPVSSTKPVDASHPSTSSVETTVISTQANETHSVGNLNAETVVKVRRLSLRSFGFGRKNPPESKPIVPAIPEHEQREQSTAAATQLAQKVQLSKADKQAQASALAVRAIIIGPSTAEPKTTTTVAKPQLSKIKSQLMEPKSANKLIAQLRRLPAIGEPSTYWHGHPKGPIHAVCLEHTDMEEHRLHFSKLAPPDAQREMSVENVDFPSVVSAPVEALASLFNEMHIVNLIKSPDFGLGQPGDGEGLLAGALPTAETVINGVRQITPELMALGYATGKAITPDHSGIYPPTDRMSVLTYWWGLEILLPPPSLAYLSNVQSISGAVINFLTALSLMNEGVREILPFVRYIAQFIDFEFDSIRKTDEGEGVVCAATWIMPAAMVPRPWDFPSPPKAPTKGEDKPDSPPSTAGPTPVVLAPSNIPGVAYSILDTVASPTGRPPVSRSSVEPRASNPVKNS